MLLPRDLKVAGRASPKSAVHEKCMQVPQGAYGNARFAKFHACAESGISHPGRQRRDYAWSNFNMQYITLTTASLLVQSQTTTIVWMPSIMDFDLLPDMGRMDPR